MSEIIHIVSRGVDKRRIFMDGKDYIRFVYDLFEFNDEEPATAFYTFGVSQKNQHYDLRSHSDKKDTRKLLVELLAFCLMPNHYHLLVSPRSKDGVTRFMRKLNIGYAKYFNEKYRRSGALFEGRYKRAHVKNEAHFLHLPYYIHLNPLDLKYPSWRKRSLINHKEAMYFLDRYKWSSHRDYMGIKNFPAVTQRELLLKLFNGARGYKKDIGKWLQQMDVSSMGDVLLEK